MADLKGMAVEAERKACEQIARRAARLAREAKASDEISQLANLQESEALEHVADAIAARGKEKVNG